MMSAQVDYIYESSNLSELVGNSGTGTDPYRMGMEIGSGTLPCFGKQGFLPAESSTPTRI